MVPPFLARLGLDTDASARNIKRAYAERLKAIDPAADPAGFARLREAFEAARAWVAARDAAMTASTDEYTSSEAVIDRFEDASDIPAAPGDDTAGPHADHPGPVPAVSAEHDARMAFDTLREALETERDTPAVDLLGGALTFLGTRQIDARPMFEAMVADALAMQQVTRRAGLLPAAVDAFGWRDADGRGRGRQRDAWIEHAVASLTNWDAFPEKRRKVLRPLLKQAGFEAGVLSPATVRNWPRIAAIMPYAREYVRLYVADTTIAQWKATFDALPPHERGSLREKAWDPRQPDVPVWRRLLGRVSGRWWWWVLIAKAVLLAIQATR